MELCSPILTEEVSEESKESSISPGKALILVVIMCTPLSFGMLLLLSLL